MSRKRPIKLLSGFLILLGILLSWAGMGFAQTNVTPAQWLARQPKPQFKPGHQLPPLSKYGWELPYDLSVETATNWGYTLELSNAENGLVNGGIDRYLADSNSLPARMVALCSRYPGKFKLSVRLDRAWPTNLSNGFWVTNSAGWFVDNNTNTWQYRTNPLFTPIVSPEAPLEDLQKSAEFQAAPLRTLFSNVPIAMVINGGERDLGVVGFDQKAWQFDPRVIAKRGTNSWPRYSSNQKAAHLSVLTEAVRDAVPNLPLYLWYHTGNEQARFNQPGYDWENDFARWGWHSDVIVPALQTPSFESYFTLFNNWTNAPGVNWNQITDLLTRHLNAVGYNLRLGYPTNYSWVCGGWSTTDTNRLAEIPRYMGFLKCLYTSGTVGANAGYYAFPISQTNSFLLGGPGFNATFPSDSPPHWLLQIEALARVHAQFSYLENYLWNGSLLPGNGKHRTSLDQPSYEFTNTVADATARVLVRKLDTSNEWLITAWAAAGGNRPITVNIPTLGTVRLNASVSGSVYRATPGNLERLNSVGKPILSPSELGARGAGGP